MNTYQQYPLSRPQDDGFCEIMCTLSIQAELLTKPLAYKYVVFAPKMKERDDCYEFLHSFSGYTYPDPNRCLHINQNKYKEGFEGKFFYSFSATSSFDFC